MKQHRFQPTLSFATTWVMLGLLTLLFAACKPDPPVTPDPVPGVFEIHFAIKWGNDDLVLSQKYLGPDGRKYQIDVLKFFISRLALRTPSDSIVNVKDVALIDMYRPDSMTIRGTVPKGSYTGFDFILGLDSALNHSNPSSFPTTHPLSAVTGMYWSWATQYIFSMIEGRADTTGGHNEDIFLYHCGQPGLETYHGYRNLNIVIGEGQTNRQNLLLDMQKVFFGQNDTINVAIDPNTHTTDNYPLALRVSRLLMAAIRSN